MTVYARCDYAKHPYLEKGKLYRVIRDYGSAFECYVDRLSFPIYSRWGKGTAHGDWTRVEIPDENPCKDLPIERDSEGNYWLKLPMTATVHQIAEARRILDGY